MGEPRWCFACSKGAAAISRLAVRERARTSSTPPRSSGRWVIQFKPGWSASLLGVAASALTDRIVPLEDIWGPSARDLCFDLLAATSVSEVVERITRAIGSRAECTFEPASSRLARRAVRLIEGGDVRVDSVAERLGVTARHLHRAFTESVGIGPKDFARAVRLQRAVKMADADRRPRIRMTLTSIMTGSASRARRATTTKRISSPTSAI